MKPIMLRIFSILCIALIIQSCNYSRSTDADIIPSDSLIKTIVVKHFTAQNEMDGGEYATVDSLNILNKTLSTNKKEVFVRYSIGCSYQPPVLPPGFQREPSPPLIKTAIMKIVFKDGNWIYQMDDVLTNNL
jgi:hypothetical protein